MKANKYHINSQGEAKPCAAQVKCRFGGETGVENHFSTVEAAQAEVQSRLQQEFSHVASVRNRGTTPQFIKNRDAIKDALVTYGGVKDKAALEEVSNTEEMVQKWFDGDSSRYKSFKRLVESSDITPETKKSVGTFVQRGVPVSLSGSVHEIPHSRSDDKFDESEVDLLEDLPGNKIDMNALRNGNLRAFI